MIIYNDARFMIKEKKKCQTDWNRNLVKKNPSIRNVQLYKYTLRRVINSKDEITRGSRDYRSLIETIS